MDSADLATRLGLDPKRLAGGDLEVRTPIDGSVIAHTSVFASQLGAELGQTNTVPLIGVVAAPPTALTPTVQVTGRPACSLLAGVDASVVAVARGLSVSVALSSLGTSSASPA